MITKKWISLIILLLVIFSTIVYNLIPGESLPADVRIEKIVVLKSRRQLIVYSGKTVIKVYRISLGRNPVGPKEFEGDKKTPEGLYYINSKNPNSKFHRNLGISYPDKLDIKYAASKGRELGGEIKIHGITNGLGFLNKLHRLINWTAGCIAVTNSEIEELYSSVPIGTPIEIRK